MPRLQCNKRQQKEHRHTQIAAERESKNASKLLRMDKKDWIEELR